MLTAKEVADRLGTGASSVRLWAKAGRFTGAQLVTDSVVSYWLIPESALEGFEKEKPGPKPGAKKKGKAGQSKSRSK